MLRGEIPDDIRPPRSWHFANRTVPYAKSLLEKHFGGSAARYPSNSWDPRPNPILEPIQVGVQTKSGCEAVVHTTRHWTKTFCDGPDRVPVLIHLANAFNCVSRGTRGWHLGPTREVVSILISWLAPVSGESSRGTRWGPPSSHSPSIHAPSKPFASRSPGTLEISITRPSFSTTGSSQERSRPSNCSSHHWSVFFARSCW